MILKPKEHNLRNLPGSQYSLVQELCPLGHLRPNGIFICKAKKTPEKQCLATCLDSGLGPVGLDREYWKEPETKGRYKKRNSPFKNKKSPVTDYRLLLLENLGYISDQLFVQTLTLFLNEASRAVETVFPGKTLLAAFLPDPNSELTSFVSSQMSSAISKLHIHNKESLQNSLPMLVEKLVSNIICSR